MAGALFSEDETSRTYGAFGGSTCSVSNGERLAIATALEEQDSNMICLVSDFQGEIQSVHT